MMTAAAVAVAAMDSFAMVVANFVRIYKSLCLRLGLRLRAAVGAVPSTNSYVFLYGDPLQLGTSKAASTHYFFSDTTLPSITFD
jgi:hypothetical protein